MMWVVSFILYIIIGMILMDIWYFKKLTNGTLKDYFKIKIKSFKEKL